VIFADYEALQERISQPMRDHAFACWKCGWGDPEVPTSRNYFRWRPLFQKCKVGVDVWRVYVTRLSVLSQVYWGRFCCRCPNPYPCEHEISYSCPAQLDYALEKLGYGTSVPYWLKRIRTPRSL
jgi:hypothetical protein